MIPYTIRTIIEQMGGQGIRGAFAYVGGHNLLYKCPQVESEYRSSYRSHERLDGGVDYDVGLMFKVNGKRGQMWHMIVAYEGDDTYTVWLVRIATPKQRAEGKHAIVLAHHEDVYWEDLQGIVEQTYDRAIKEHNQGFIPC